MEEHGNSIVRELLDKYNYEEWSIQMKTYLLAQGLWDIVKKRGVRTPKRNKKAKLKVWTRKNVDALRVIQRSCGEDCFGVIKDITSAKIAWATLADEYGSKADYAPVKGTDHNSDFQRHKSFFDHVRHGNWDTAKTYLDQLPDAVRARIDSSGRTPLHIAVSAGHLQIVEDLVQSMEEGDMLTEQKDGFTVLALSIRIGNLPIAKCLIRKNKKLLSVVHETEGIPVLHAVCCDDFKMARFLYSVTPKKDLTLRDNGKIGANIIYECINRQNFDIPLDLLKHCPRLAITAISNEESPVHALSYYPKSIFPSGFQLGFWQRWLYDCINVDGGTANHVIIDVQNKECGQRDRNDLTAIRSVLVGVLAWMPSILLQLLDIRAMYETKLVHVQSDELLSRMCEEIRSSFDENKLLKEGCVGDAILEAVYTGNVEFIMRVAKANPELLWTNDLAFDVFMLAIECRQEEVFSLIHGLLDKQAIVCRRDRKYHNNMLHKAASMPSSKILNLIPGPALQMQRQLQWFKEVETVMTPAYNKFSNKDDLRPQVLFTQNHKDLVIAGEKWMKDTSSSCTVVGALIVTITFAAAFTVPGGSNQDTGFSIFRNNKLFKAFIISDAMSLFSSTTSVLMFLGILTSRYAEEDFLKSLPKKMIIGLSTLFFSIATMMIAFCVSVSMMLQDKWIALLVSLLASVPVTLFVMMQFPLLVDIYKSTYGPSIFNRNVKRWL